MSDTPNESNQPETQGAAPTVNQLQQSSPQDISALAAYRAARQAASSPPAEPKAEGGDTRPNAGGDQAQPQREGFIPRERFDEVHQRMKSYEQQLQQFQQSQPQAQPNAFGTPQMPQMPQFPMQQPLQQVGPTGMVQGQQQQPQQTPQAPDFNDPKVQREWREKIANNPITGMREFTEHIIRSYGEPLVNQAVQGLYQQLQPLQRAFVNQQIQTYAQQRQADPSFQQVQPYFQNLVQQAQQRGVDVTNPQVLGTIEYMAKQQAQAQGMQFAPPQQPPQQQPPFTERPGNSGASLGQSQTPTLTPQQQAMARTFGMSDREYAESLRNMGAMR